MVLTIIYILIAGSIMLMAYSFYTKEEIKLSAELKVASVAKKGDDFLRRPIQALRFLAPFNKRVVKILGKNLESRLSLADLNMFPEDFMAIKEVAILGLLLLCYFGFNNIDPLVILMCFLFGWVLPDIYLTRRIQTRKRMIVKTLPDAIDLLSLCVEGGLDFMLGLKWVVKRMKPTPLIKEFHILIHEINVGRSRQEALKNMSRRLKMPEIFSFVNTLVHADRMGTPVSEVLHILADEARRQRFQRGERLALTAPIKMLFPLIVFILPVVAIIVGGPILMQFMNSNITTKLGQ